MRSLQKEIKELKEKINKKKEEYSELDKKIKEFIDTNLNKQNKYIKSFYVKSRTLHIETTHKIVAQEIRMRISILEKKLPLTIKSVKVK